MNIKEFEYLAEIAAQESISKAAARLYLSQPTLTKFLKKIEEEFKTPLFYRIGKKMVPTPAGQSCIDKAREIIEINNQMNKEVEYIRQTDHGYIRIGTSQSRGEFFIARILPEMTRTYPAMRFTLILGAKAELMEKLEKNELDIIFVTNSSERAYLNYQPVAREEMVLVVPAHHELLKKAVIREGFRYPYIPTGEWHGYPFIMADVRMTTGQYVRLLFEHYQLSPNIVLEIAALQHIYSAVRQNIGITIAPSMPLLTSEHTNLHYLSFEDSRNIEWYFTAILKEQTILTDTLNKLIWLAKEQYY